MSKRAHVVKLRASQRETLQAVERNENEFLVTPRLLADVLDASAEAAESRLRRLCKRRLVSFDYHGPSWNAKAVYRLTDKGRKALEGEQP